MHMTQQWLLNLVYFGSDGPGGCGWIAVAVPADSSRFLLYLRRTSSRVRAHHLKDHCEVCGADGRNSRGLCVSPVYTHMEIANESAAGFC